MEGAPPVRKSSETSSVRPSPINTAELGIIRPASYLLIACPVISGEIRSASSRIENPAFFRASLSRCPSIRPHSESVYNIFSCL